MVQVDVFWSYGIGAGFAVSASRQLVESKSNNEDPFSGFHFSRALLVLAAIFAPSGIYLVWAFPGWETMHVGDRNMPAWLITAFACTNITQGVLGYWIARRQILRNKGYEAFLHWLGAYFVMFFVLVHGWDGTGYQRFFSATELDLQSFSRSTFLAFFTSDVALTLYGMGAVLIPALLYYSGTWLRDGRKKDGGHRPSAFVFALGHLAVVFGAGLGSAIGASLLVRPLGWPVGLLVFAALAYILGIRKGGLYRRIYARLLGEAA